MTQVFYCFNVLNVLTLLIIAQLIFFLHLPLFVHVLQRFTSHLENAPKNVITY